MSDGARVTQEAIEVLRLGNGKARVTQEAIEVLRLGNAHARITQLAIEVLVGPAPVVPNGFLLRRVGVYYFNVGEILNMDGPLKTRDLIDVTHEQSTDQEFISGNRKKIIAFTMNFTESVFSDLNDDYQSNTPRHFVVQLDLDNMFEEFDALISKLTPLASYDKQVTARCEMVILN